MNTRAHIKRSPRVALCVLGTVRGFTHNSTIANMRRNIIQAAPVTDAFFKIRLSERLAKPHRVYTRHGAIVAHADYTSVAEAVYSLHDYLESSTLQMISDDPPVMMDERCYCVNSTYHQGFMNRLDDLRWCYDQVVSREVRVGQLYDAIITMRADLLVGAPLPPVACLSALCLNVSDDSRNSSRSGRDDMAAVCGHGLRMYKDRDHLWIVPRALAASALTGIFSQSMAACPGEKSRQNATCAYKDAYGEHVVRSALMQLNVPCVISSFREVMFSVDASGKVRRRIGRSPLGFEAPMCVSPPDGKYWQTALKPHPMCTESS